ncbi:ABC transporter ATP-binding protein [Persicobacter sp. CCB-QB2]|uniref:ABC transporter transmembrane domain-containing protein n=1 Tax=Persicobacter sp. CCB-QB2 TaxID=1561025 RepID=UPI0006A9737E|nr:ABC transporter ATP-binding protein [Persicobacter sp. CCB-QB2]
MKSLFKHPCLQFLLSRKWTSAKIVGLGIIANLLTIIIPVSVGKYYQLVFHFKGHRVRFLDFLPKIWWDTVPKFILFFFILVSARFLFQWWYQKLLRAEGELFIKSIKDQLFTHQLALPLEIYHQKGVGKYLLRYSGDIQSLKNLYLKGSLEVTIDFSILTVGMYWLLQLQFEGGLAILIMSALSLIVIRYLNKQVESHSLDKRNKTSGQLSFVSRTLHGMLSVIMMNKQEVEQEKYANRSGQIKKAAVSYNSWLMLNKGYIHFFQYTALTVVLYLFYINTDSDAATGGGPLISFILLYITLLPVFRRLFALETVYKLGHISLRKLQDILNIPEEKRLEGAAFPSHPIQLEWHFKAQGQHLKLENGINQISLSNGLSPFLFTKHLLKIQMINDLKLRLNEKAIADYAAQGLRQNIGVASSDFPLLGRTVYEAITYSRLDSIKSHTREVLENIQTLCLPPEEWMTLSTNTGENGTKVNQRQREVLALCRAILQEKAITLVYGFQTISPPLLNDILSIHFKTGIWFSIGEAFLSQEEKDIIHSLKK